MLHAFNLGILSVKSIGTQRAVLTGSNLGEEAWAFIPKNSLPYLKYFTDKNYSHLYSIDGRTLLFDASIGIGPGCTETTDYWKCTKDTAGGSNWRSIVISGMGLGGASRDNVVAETCVEGVGGTCVKTPLSGNGFSSYFALDVTDPLNPKYLWEFSNNLLGYATSAPAIVGIGHMVLLGATAAQSIMGTGVQIDAEPGQVAGDAGSGRVRSSRRTCRRDDRSIGRAACARLGATTSTPTNRSWPTSR